MSLRFPVSTSSMEPLWPGEDARLRAVADTLLKESSQLDGLVPAAARAPVKQLLGIINCYYSNLIEGDKTYLYDIQAALKKDFSNNPEKERLQHFALANVRAQQVADALVAASPDVNVMGDGFICVIHDAFYQQLAPHYRIQTSPDGTLSAPVLPGRIRDRDITVGGAGGHLPPAAAHLPAFLTRFGEVYRLDRFQGVDRFIAVMASHQRLTWIHPFLDGNGRVSRIHLKAALLSAGMPGVDFWSLPRAFARDRAGYMRALQTADAPRQGGFDGRGALSLAGLKAFCAYALEQSLDQVRFMRELLGVEAFTGRMRHYLSLRAQGLIPGQPRLHAFSSRVLSELLLAGELRRSAVPALLGVSERQARDIVTPLLREGLLETTGHKAPVTLGIPVHALEHYFPALCHAAECAPPPTPERIAIIEDGETLTGRVCELRQADKTFFMVLETDSRLRGVPYDPRRMHPKIGEHVRATLTAGALSLKRL